MSILRNVGLMGASTLIRMGSGFLSFLVMARLLGPEAFGIVMLWMSVATLATLVANFGFAPYLLREIGARPESARAVMGETLSAKLLLSSIVLTGGLAALPWVEAPDRLIFVSLLAALLADSLTEFLNVGFRVTGRFAEETRLASVASLLQFTIVGTAVWYRPTAECASIAILVSRTAVAFGVWAVQWSYFSGLRLAGLPQGLRRIQSAVAYGADFGLQSLFGQIDSIVLNHYVGTAEVGLYQAGMRLFNSGAQAAGVLANVFLPRAAAATTDHSQFRAESVRVQWAFVTVGTLFGLALAIAAEPIVHLLFGPEYARLTDLLPWMGVLFFVRFYAASWGIVLTSVGQQTFRAWVNFTQWLGVLLLASMFVPRWGSTGWLLSLIAGNLFIAMSYALRGCRHAGLRWQQVVFAIGSATMFVPWIRWPA